MTHLSMEDIQVLNAMEQLTGAKAEDVIATEDKLIFMVPKSDVGKAIGKGGSNVVRLSQAFKKQVEIVQAASEEKELFANLFFPAAVQELAVKDESGKKSLDVKVNVKDRGLAIGRNGEKIKRAKVLAKRYYNYEDVRIVTR